LAIGAIEACCDVCGKTGGIDRSGIDAMNRAARQRRVKLCVGHSRLCALVMLVARNLVEDWEIRQAAPYRVSYHFDITTIVPLALIAMKKSPGFRAYPEVYFSTSCPSGFNHIGIHQGASPDRVTGRSNGIDSRWRLDEVRAFFAGIDVTGFSLFHWERSRMV
jgi:hypothetical protein